MIDYLNLFHSLCPKAKKPFESEGLSRMLPKTDRQSSDQRECLLFLVELLGKTVAFSVNDAKQQDERCIDGNLLSGSGMDANGNAHTPQVLCSSQFLTLSWSYFSMAQSIRVLIYKTGLSPFRNFYCYVKKWACTPPTLNRLFSVNSHLLMQLIRCP